MKIYVSEEDKKQFKTYGDDTVYELKVVDNLTWSFNSNMVDLQSLEQHDAEIKKPLEEEIESLKNKLADLTEEYELTVEGFDREYAKQNVQLGKAFNARNSERLKVIAELEEFENEHRLRARKISEEYPTDNEEQKARLYALSSGRFDILEELKQKLKEMKGGKL